MERERRQNIANLISAICYDSNEKNPNNIKCVINRYIGIESDDELMDRILITIGKLENEGFIEDEVNKRGNLLLKIYPEKYGNIEAIQERLDTFKKLNVLDADKSIKEKNRDLQETWERFAPLLDKGYDYFAMGTLAYLLKNKKSATELTRYHDNIDLLVNEEDIKELIESIKRDEQFKIETNFNDHEEFAPTFIARDKNGIAVKLHLFDRNEHNMTICYLSYFNQGGKLKCHYEELNDLLSTYAFHDDTHLLSLNYVYATKERRGLDKDRYDNSIIEPYMNKDLIDTMKYDMADSIIGITSGNTELISEIVKGLKAETKIKR